MNPRSQERQILRHLATGRPLTQLTAWKRFRCFRLSGRIFDLKRDGHDIVTTRVTRGGKTFASYRLAR